MIQEDPCIHDSTAEVKRLFHSDSLGIAANILAQAERRKPVTDGTSTMNYAEYGEWISREPPYPGLGIGDKVVLLPAELGQGTIIGTIRMENGSGDSWGISVPYGADGALMYIHKADVAPADQASLPKVNAEINANLAILLRRIEHWRIAKFAMPMEVLEAATTIAELVIRGDEHVRRAYANAHRDDIILEEEAS